MGGTIAAKSSPLWDRISIRFAFLTIKDTAMEGKRRKKEMFIPSALK